MALTFGFYNSIEGDRKYDAIQFGRIFDGIITDGVYATYEKGMVVKASDNAGEVIIQPGRAWFNHTWNYNDADYVMEAPAPEVLLDRIDALVLDINEEQAVRENSFAWVTGTPSSNPVRPTLTNTTTHHQYPLCYVRRYAETTMIYTKDITSMVGTSECPFVTGVLEGMDIDAWINQWDDEFSTWEDATKVSFEAWMLTQQTDYTAWFNAVRDQLGTDMTEFEAWFESIKGIIDEEAATHLQAEIDELKTMLPAGSHITITTTDTELFSRNVLLRDDFGHEITSKFNTSGVAVFETVPYVGSLTISSTDGIRTATNVVNTPYFARYEFSLAFWSATVNIEGDENLAGYTVTVYNSEETVVSSIVLNAEAKGVFNATYPDEFIFRITYGGETMEVSLDVREETTYTVTLSAGINWRTWCTLGGVSTSGYSDLSDVFDDEVAVRRLMTVHASADYLIECVTKKLTTIDDFVANDTAMKWIGLRDYVCDGLTAITGVEAKFLASDYWERYLKDHVPVMTSDTAPYGTASDNSHASKQEAYHAFDGDESTYWNANSVTSNKYMQYKFVNPVCVKKIYISDGSMNRINTYKIQASNDGSTFTDITGTLTYDDSNRYVNIENDNYYLYYRLYVLTATTNITIATFQFYGRALDVSVPVMTSDTTPYGEAKASGIYINNTSFYAYKAFDGDNSTGWYGAKGVASGWIEYKFANLICIKNVAYKQRTSDTQGNINHIKTGAILGSNDGINYEEIYVIDDSGIPSSQEETIHSFSNTEYYLYIRLRIDTLQYIGTEGEPILNTLQFYGVDYSEKEFASGSTMKYLYDHGVELETINGFATGTGATFEKRAESLYANRTATQGTVSGFATNSPIDMTDYTVERIHLGDEEVTISGANLTCGNLSASNNNTTSVSDTAVASIMCSGAYNQFSHGLDVTAINESKYPKVYGYSGGGYPNKFTITEWWLE